MANGELIISAKQEELAKVETIVAAVSAEGGMGDGGHFGRAFRMAAGIRALHHAISDAMMRDIMHLQGTTLGFLTDKDDPTKNNPPGYPIADVKLVAIEAALLGAYWVGNEFNIIANRPYLTKNFFTRKLREFPGLTDLKLFPGVPSLSGDKGALVPYVATWKFNGEEMKIERLLTKLDNSRELDERIPIRVNAGMGADAILGKAERKIKAQIYNRLTGSDLTDGDIDDVPAHKKPARSMDDLADRLKGSANGNGHDAGDRPQTGDSPDDTMLEACRLELQEMNAIGDVEATKNQYLRQAKTEADRTAIAGLAEARANEIRAARGTRSNKEPAGA